MRFEENYYSFFNHKLNLKAAVLSDLHECVFEDVLRAVRNADVNLIFVVGDLVNGAELEKGRPENDAVKYAVSFINACEEIAPTYVSLGNHEKWVSKAGIEIIKERVNGLLDNEWIRFSDELVLGGVSSLRNYGANVDDAIDENFLQVFSSQKEYKILLCHHPEYYKKYLLKYDIQLIVSGHAHGGQIRLLNRGLYAPGQGLFPQYTSGAYDERLLVSRGLSGTEIFPRVFNRPEVIYIEL